MLLEKIYLDILKLLTDNLSEEIFDTGNVSRKILFKSVNYKQKQIEKACKELKEIGFVELHAGFYKKTWSSISITDEGLDFIEFEADNFKSRMH
jgi:predicted transcriptional regulator